MVASSFVVLLQASILILLSRPLIWEFIGNLVPYESVATIANEWSCKLAHILATCNRNNNNTQANLATSIRAPAKPNHGQAVRQPLKCTCRTPAYRDASWKPCWGSTAIRPPSLLLWRWQRLKRQLKGLRCLQFFEHKFFQHCILWAVSFFSFHLALAPRYLLLCTSPTLSL